MNGETALDNSLYIIIATVIITGLFAAYIRDFLNWLFSRVSTSYRHRREKKDKERKAYVQRLASDYTQLKMAAIGIVRDVVVFAALTSMCMGSCVLYYTGRFPLELEFWWYYRSLVLAIGLAALFFELRAVLRISTVRRAYHAYRKARPYAHNS